MKKFILIAVLAFSGATFAETKTVIFPRIYNWGNSVQVDVWNYSNIDVTCSGPIYMTLESGATQYDSYFDWVPARTSRFRTIYSRDLNDRIRSVNHNIWCN